MKTANNFLSTLGKYKLQKELGKGGFGTVYLATDSIERKVAVKVLKPGFADDADVIARFKREALAAGSLFHPHIATILDLDEADGRIFLVMRYIEGKSLDVILKERQKLPLDEVIPIMQQVGEGLQFAHEKGFIHRDIKPANIIISPTDGAVLTDFGLVRSASTSGMSTTGVLLGTPAYIAPEIWRGKPATPASDIYSMGCIFYEMLTGKILFEGETPVDIMTKHVLDGPRLDEDLPLNLNQILQKMLAMNPQERSQDISKIINELRSKLEQVPHNQATILDNPPFEIKSDNLQGQGKFQSARQVYVFLRSHDEGSDWEYAGETPGEVEIPDNFDLGIKINNSNYSTEMLAELIDEIENYPIIYLDLGFNDLLDENALKVLQNLATLEELDLRYCIGINDFSILDLQKLPRLKSLYLQDLKHFTDNGLAILSSIPTLEELSLYDCDAITGSGFANFSYSTKIKNINVGDCESLSDEGVYHLAKIKSLKSLTMSGCKLVSDQGISNFQDHECLEILYIENCEKVHGECLHFLKKLKTLKRFSIHGNPQISEIHLDHLADFENLEELNLGRSPNINKQSILFFTHLERIKALYLYDCENLDDSCLELICRNSGLTTLSLRGCKQISDRGFVGISKLSSLEWLHLGDTLISDGTLKSVGQLSQLATLKLDDCKGITDTGLSYVSSLLNLKNLSIMNCTKINGSGFLPLSSLPKLNAFSLYGVSLSNQGLENYSKLPFSSKINSLSLDGNEQITGQGLVALENFPELTELKLSNMKSLRDIDLSRISKLQKLTRLDISHNEQLSDSCLIHLSNMVSLTELTIESCTKITGAGFSYLKNLPSLQKISFNRASLDDQGLNNLSKLSVFSEKAEELDLSYNDSITDDGLRVLPVFKNLKKIKITGCKRLTLAGLSVLHLIPAIEEVEFYGFPQNDEYYRLISQLPVVAQSIREINNFSFSEEDQITDVTMAILDRFINLEALSLSGNNHITDRGFSCLQRLKNLKSLTIMHCKNFSDTSLANIKALIGLEKLDISINDNISDSGLENLKGLVNLQKLYLSSVKEISLSGIMHISYLKKLEELDLNFCQQIDDFCLSYISNLANLRILDLSFTSITDEGLQNLVRLRELEFLKLTQCENIRGMGIKSLSGLPKLKVLYLNIDDLEDWNLNDLSNFKHIEELHLGHTKIGGLGLSSVGQLKTLKKLNLDGCVQIKDHDLQNLKYLSDLTELNLTRCENITDRGISFIVEIKSLEDIDLSNCEKITSFGLHSLKNLPNLTNLKLYGLGNLSKSAIKDLERDKLTIFS